MAKWDGSPMLAYTEHDNAQAVEIVLSGRVSTEEFDAAAKRLDAFIKRHGQVRVLEVIKDFEGMDAAAFWHDVKFSLRHLHDFSRLAVVANPDTRQLWSSLVAPFINCEVEHFLPHEEDAARDWLLWPEGAADA
ncbi:MAG: STAS/SEC14 domain-containing protein [Methyloceanibacter sp.]